MSDTKKKFYNLFWQNKSCQNLFLLSKEELLDTTTFISESNTFSYSLSRIIISNSKEKENYHTIKIRNENQNISLDKAIDNKIDFFKPLIEKFVDAKYKKSMDRLLDDIEKKGLSMLGRFFRIVVNEKTREEQIVLLLQDYGFIGKHINSFDEIKNDLEKYFIPNKNNELINEKTLITFFEGVKYFKELYVNHSLKKLYSTNQVLTNTLNSDDDFTSRLKLFHYLYESDILFPSSEDAFIECSECPPGTYKGVFQLRMNPKKLQELKCPVCSQELTYFVPYELNSEIYNIIKSPDGLLLDAYCNVLDKNKFSYNLNQHFLYDIEVDCVFETNDLTYIVEAKMYKQNTTKEKLKAKMRGHFGKLIADLEKLQNLEEFKNKSLRPILLVNIIDSDLIREVEKELKEKNFTFFYQNARILNLELLK